MSRLLARLAAALRWRRGADLADWPMRSVKRVELRDALAADLADNRKEHTE